MPEPTARDWPEDFDEENGCYLSICCSCFKLFYGHKHRSTCKECHDD